MEVWLVIFPSSRDEKVFMRDRKTDFPVFYLCECLCVCVYKKRKLAECFTTNQKEKDQKALKRKGKEEKEKFQASKYPKNLVSYLVVS